MTYKYNNERVKKVILWLIGQGVAETQEDIALKLGYNPSSVSQIVGGIKPVSKKFAGNLASLSDKININYLLHKDENMLMVDNRNEARMLENSQTGDSASFLLDEQDVKAIEDLKDSISNSNLNPEMLNQLIALQSQAWQNFALINQSNAALVAQNKELIDEIKKMGERYDRVASQNNQMFSIIKQHIQSDSEQEEEFAVEKKKAASGS